MPEIIKTNTLIRLPTINYNNTVIDEPFIYIDLKLN
jgi:hypothetical protein